MVQGISAQKPTYWYADKINKYFMCNHYHPDMYLVLGPGGFRTIEACDCEEVPEDEQG